MNPKPLNAEPARRAIQLIDPIADPRWDRFVENHPFGWVCHLSGWKQVLEQSFKHMKGHYFVIVDEKDNIKAGLPVYEVKSWLTGKRLVSIPFGTLCDPLVSSEDDFKQLFGAARSSLKRFSGTCMEIRTVMASSLLEQTGLGKRSFYKHHYMALDKRPEELKKGFHRTCVRQRISRAQKSDLVLTIAAREEDLNQYYRLHRITRKRTGLPLQPYAFFRNLWNAFHGKGLMDLFLAKKGEDFIAGIILFKFKDRVSAEFAGSDYRYVKISPNHFLFWEAIQMACEQGYQVFDFGRTSPNNQNLMDFKNRWGTAVKDLPQFFDPKDAVLDMANREETGKYRLMSRICANAPDRYQPLIGSFCYRHLG